MIRILGRQNGGQIDGVMRFPERTVTATQTLTTADNVVYLDTTGGAFTATLPAVPGARGCLLIVRWSAGASAPTLSGGGVSHTFGAVGDAVIVHASASGWGIVAQT